MGRLHIHIHELATLIHDQLDALTQSIDDTERTIDLNRWIRETRALLPARGHRG